MKKNIKIKFNRTEVDGLSSVIQRAMNYWKDNNNSKGVPETLYLSKDEHSEFLLECRKNHHTNDVKIKFYEGMEICCLSEKNGDLFKNIVNKNFEDIYKNHGKIEDYGKLIGVITNTIKYEQGNRVPILPQSVNVLGLFVKQINNYEDREFTFFGTMLSLCL